MFKELSESAASQEELVELKRQFGMALFVTDSLISAYSRRVCSVSDQDLRIYFAGMGIVAPTLPGLELGPALRRLMLEQAPVHGQEMALKTALHLIQCWVCAAQRHFARLFAPPAKTLDGIAEGIGKLWECVDHIREGITFALSVVASTAAPPYSHTHSHPHSHYHESNFGPRLIRLDRDLLDLFSMAWASLKLLPRPGLPQLEADAESRVRRALRVQSFYAKTYVGGDDLHMIYHHYFQLEHNVAWATMALQQVGEPGGPQCQDEVVTELERAWLVEGLELMSFYSPL